MAENNIEVKITVNNIKAIEDATDEAIEKALTMIGMQAANYASNLTPRDTGLLANSMTYALSGKGAAISDYKGNKPNKKGEKPSGSYSGTAPDSGNSVYIGTNVEYAPYIELGTSKMKKHPGGVHMIRRAVQDHTDEYKRMVEDALRNA